MSHFFGQNKEAWDYLTALSIRSAHSLLGRITVAELEVSSRVGQAVLDIKHGYLFNPRDPREFMQDTRFQEIAFWEEKTPADVGRTTLCYLAAFTTSTTFFL